MADCIQPNVWLYMPAMAKCLEWWALLGPVAWACHNTAFSVARSPAC